MHSQSPKGQWFACPVVDQEHLRVQDHAVAPRESPGDEVLKVGHLEAEGSLRGGSQDTESKSRAPEGEHRTPICASLADVQNRLRSWQLARQEQSAMFQDLCPDPGRGQAHIGVSFYWLQRIAGKRNSLKVKMRGRREADKHGTEGGKVGRRDSCRTDQWEKGWKERNELP